MNPAIRLIQTASKSLGHDPKGADGWWGPDTEAAIRSLHRNGPKSQTEWAVETLERGLQGLGHYTAETSGEYSGAVMSSLGNLLAAKGEPKASAVSGSGAVLTPIKPLLPPTQHSGTIKQGSKGYTIDTFCLHCGALPGDWHIGKTHAQIADAIHRMHTDPPSRGGRGWSDTGYHAIVCPDGVIVLARPENVIGAGAKGYNRGVYHMLMIETKTITKMATAETYFTPKTLAAAKDHIEHISRRTPIRRLMGHNEVAAKLCPGFVVNDAEWTDRVVT